MYLNPETVSGITVSLQIVFAAIAGGVYSMFGQGVGALLALALTEGLRVWFGTDYYRRGQHHLRHPARALHHLHAARRGGGAAGDRLRRAQEKRKPAVAKS